MRCWIFPLCSGPVLHWTWCYNCEQLNLIRSSVLASPSSLMDLHSGSRYWPGSLHWTWLLYRSISVSPKLLVTPWLVLSFSNVAVYFSTVHQISSFFSCFFDLLQFAFHELLHSYLSWHAGRVFYRSPHLQFRLVLSMKASLHHRLYLRRSHGEFFFRWDHFLLWVILPIRISPSFDGCTDTDDTVLIQVLGCFFTYVRNIRCKFFFTKFGITNLCFKFTDMNRSENIFFTTFSLITMASSKVVTLPWHECHFQVTSKCQFSVFGCITFGKKSPPSHFCPFTTAGRRLIQVSLVGTDEFGEFVNGESDLKANQPFCFAALVRKHEFHLHPQILNAISFACTWMPCIAGSFGFGPVPR